MPRKKKIFKLMVNEKSNNGISLAWSRAGKGRRRHSVRLATRTHNNNLHLRIDKVQCLAYVERKDRSATY